MPHQLGRYAKLQIALQGLGRAIAREVKHDFLWLFGILQGVAGWLQYRLK